MALSSQRSPTVPERFEVVDPGKVYGDAGEWLNYGIEKGYCSEIVCATHDGLPMDDLEEEAEYPEDYLDMCVPAIRIW